MVELQPSKLTMRVRFPLPAHIFKLECLMEKIRKLFRVDSNYQLFIVNIVFAITGSLALYFAGILLDLIDINANNTNTFLYWTLRITLILPVYQVLLLLVGTIFGEFEYFWAMEKKIISRFKRK